MTGKINLSSSPEKKLFTTEQWRKIEADPTSHIDASDWAVFSREQKMALKRLRRDWQRDGQAKPPRPQYQNALQGGDGGGHWAGRDLAVHEIQGLGPKTPFEGQQVRTEGIVTALDDHGFYLQEPNQGIEQGSPGIYVQTGGRPELKPGDAVSVAGTAQEHSVSKYDTSGSTIT